MMSSCQLPKWSHAVLRHHVPETVQIMNKRERYRVIADLLREDGYVSVDVLSAKLAVSKATIRRDLREFGAQGLLTRTHGGAAFSGRTYEVPLRYRRGEREGEKRRIAAVAASRVTEGAVIGLTGGTTTTEVARRLPARGTLTVVTNALNIAADLALRPNVRLVDTGGIARPVSFELTGPIAEHTVSRYHLDLLFLGVDGIDPVNGCTTHDDGEAQINRAMVLRADRVVVVADGSKIGRRAFAQICGIDSVAEVITTDVAEEERLQALRTAGVAVVQV